MAGVPGGVSAYKPADDEVRAVFENDEARASVAAKLGSEAPRLKVLEYKTQVVAGVNYVVRAEIDDGKIAIIRAFRGLDKSLTINGAELEA